MQIAWTRLRQLPSRQPALLKVSNDGPPDGGCDADSSVSTACPYPPLMSNPPDCSSVRVGQVALANLDASSFTVVVSLR